ncbi:MAG TPA: oligosaccharide flippase family protein [Candidatus Saccharimonadales bacterium]|nr:oligosaccharide flippase family protein [Candidatus Saccharimonadales bacterium]
MNLIKHARSSRFLRHNGIFFFGAAAVGALNYLYYPVMGRLLDTVAFGEVQTLISLFLQITIFLSVMGLVAINVVANYTSTTLRNAVVWEFEKLALCIGIVLLLLSIAFGNEIAQFLHFDSLVPFSLLMLALIATVPLTFRSAYLRGLKKFGLVSLGNIVSACGKLALAVVLVLAGFNTAGAIGGLVAAQLLAFMYVAWWAAKLGLQRPEQSRWLAWPDFRLLAPELRYGLLVLVGSLVITLQYSLDVIVVKHFFDPHTAGLYAGIASVARIIFFATASIAMVLMSLVKVSAPTAQNEKVLVKSLVLTAAVGLPVLVLCVVWPTGTTSLLMGQAYAEVAPILPRLATAIFIVAMLNVFVSYYLALRRFMIAPILGIGALTTYVLMYVHHGSLGDVVNSLLIGSLVMLATIILWIGSKQAKEFVWLKR